ncbi:MAG: nucleotidyltransferase domain-containing protein [Syntrophomonadaceae bacterium]|nr:nucleotidyltransferase domain-containing protein [Syntrophomonadaceae bacterium]MDD4549607.1 nucleotidyltransferase domain-containing protein [Syntrophomonadaceae bacterium]
MIDISDIQMEEVLNILERYVPDMEVWAFGSRVKGNAKSYSDLDLLIIGDEKMSINQWGELKEAFQESDLPFRVDLLDWHQISPEFRQVIKQKYEILKKRQMGG